MKSVIKKRRLFVPFLLIFSMLWLTANSQEGSKDELKTRGTKYFLDGDYEKAMSDFKTLHDLYPKDPEISYFLGRSYLHCFQQSDEAAKLLKFAATRNYGEDAYFFLGRAYHLNYQFDEADMAYSTFKKTAKTRFLKEYEVDYWIEANKNAKKSVTAVFKAPLVKKTQIPINIPESAFAENTTGKYIYVPDEFKSATDKALNYQTVMFLSKDVQVDDYLYFDCKSVKSKTGTDIYRVKRLQNEEYSIPERLSDVINTAVDEAYPFFDKATYTLYFSSKGYNTSGGFDIFYSKYDVSTRQWSTPEKLEFPINTPYDDYLYTLASDQASVTFLSNRNSLPGSIGAYTIPVIPPGEYLSLWSKDDIRSYALFENVHSEAEKTPDSFIEKNIADKSNYKEPIVESETVSEVTKPVQSEYDLILAEALNLQAHSDSLGWCVKDLKRQAQNENNFQKKQQLSSNASILESEAQRIQNLASAKFLQAEALRGDKTGQETVAQNKPRQPLPLEQNIKVIAYPEESIEISKTANREPEVTKTYAQGYEAAAKIAVPQIAEGFKIEGSSPYSKDNPIPFQAKLPDGLIYRIQLGAYSGVIEETAFKGLTPVTAEKTKNKDITKYYVGYFASIEDARQALNEVKSYGYPDAFLVSYYNKEKIAIQKAREIEFAEK
jgi:hypothetical protein